MVSIYIKTAYSYANILSKTNCTTHRLSCYPLTPTEIVPIGRTKAYADPTDRHPQRGPPANRHTDCHLWQSADLAPLGLCSATQTDDESRLVLKRLFRAAKVKDRGGEEKGHSLTGVRESRADAGASVPRHHYSVVLSRQCGRILGVAGVTPRIAESAPAGRCLIPKGN